MGKKFARGGMLKNPNFQRSVGTQMQSADRKAKEVLGGGRPIGLAKQNTNHGKLDLPVAGLNKYAGFKKGGIMRKGKRFDVGGNVSTEDWLKESTKDYSRKGETLEDAAARRYARDNPAPIRESAAPQKPMMDDDDSDSLKRIQPEGVPRGPEAQEISKPGARAASRPAAKAATPKRDMYPANEDQVSRTKPRDMYPANEDQVSRTKSRPSGEDLSKPYMGTSRKKSVSDTLTPEQRSKNADDLADQLALSAIPGARVAKTAAKPAAKMLEHWHTPAQMRDAGGKAAKMLSGPAERKMLSGPAERKMLSGPAKRKMLSGPPERIASESQVDLSREGTGGWGNALKKGGNVKESKAMVNKEVSFFKKKGAPKSMIKHEKAEAKTMKYAKGGSIMRSKKDIANDQMKMAPYAKGGNVKGYMANHGFENRSTNGTSRAGENTKVQKKGLTEGRMVKMATGGVVKFARGGGIEARGKTRGKMC